MQKEIWKDISGYEGLYQASTLGNVRSVDRNVIYKNGVVATHRGKILKPKMSGNDYLHLTPSKGNVAKKEYVHRLIALTHCSNPNNLPFVNHKDGNKLNNCADNLEWVSRSENCIHSYRVLDNKNPKRKRIINKETGQIFESLRPAAKHLNVNYGTLSSWLSGNRTNPTNLQYL
jgi:hypothetical protein